MTAHESVGLLRTGCIVLLGIAAASVGFGLALAPSRPASRLGLRGLKRQRALASNPLWRALEPLVRWLGVRVAGLLPDALRQRLDRQVALAGDVLGLTAEEYVATLCLSGVAGGVVALAINATAGLALNLALMLFVPLGVALPYLQITSAGQDRVIAISRGLPFAIDLLAMAMAAGVDFPGAVRQVVEKAPNPSDPSIEELTLLLQGLNVGRSRREVLEEFALRAPCEAVTQFTGAVIQAEKRGNPLAEVLQIQASTYRTRRSAKGEEAAAKASVQMIAPLFLVFVSVLLLIVGPMVVKLSNLE